MLEIAEEVADALAEGRPVVALESTLVAHGLPRPDNLRVAREVEAAVRAGGAVPATVAVLDGRVRVGLDDTALEAVALGADVVKAGVRDLGPALATRTTAATTVSATAWLAHRAGIGTFATGGLGGVHRGGALDESADLWVLGAVPTTVVCAGVKSILDVGATLERLESLSVTVLGYRTDRFPGFYLSDSGFPVPWRADSPAEVAAVVAARRRLGATQALVVAQPLPVERQVDPALHDQVLADALAAADAAGVSGKDVTPYVLARFHAQTGGESLRANVDLVLANATLAAAAAVADTAR